jgi:hypothetical protein
MIRSIVKGSIAIKALSVILVWVIVVVVVVVVVVMPVNAQETKASIISKCFNAGKITLKSQAGTSSPMILGGIGGRLVGYIVKDCYNLGNILS